MYIARCLSTRNFQSLSNIKIGQFCYYQSTNVEKEEDGSKFKKETLIF